MDSTKLILDSLVYRLNTSRKFISSYAVPESPRTYESGYDRAVRDEILYLERLIEQVQDEIDSHKEMVKGA